VDTVCGFIEQFAHDQNRVHEHAGSFQQDQTVAVVFFHDIFCYYKLLADILKCFESVYGKGFNGRTPVHREFAVMRISALPAKRATLSYQSKSLVIPSQKELPFYGNGAFPNLDLPAPFLVVIPVKLGTFNTSTEQESLFVFIQNDSHLVRRWRLGWATPTFSKLLAAVFTLQQHPICHADVRYIYKKNFIDAVLLSQWLDCAENFSFFLRIL
jgi:hypothetical protein